MAKKKVVIISAPSGAGKTTMVKHLLSHFPQLEFSVSACSRPKRENETHGVDYYFLTVEEFKQRIQNNEFVEWQEVYPNSYYGTLKTEVERIWAKNHIVLFDVDVLGGINLKNIFKNKAVSIFIAPPSISVLKERLEKRGTENAESLKQRIEKAEYEMKFQSQFDYVVVNDNLQLAIEEITAIVSKHI